MNSDKRGELLRKIITFHDDIDQCYAEISAFSWDCDRELVELSRADIENVLHKLNGKEISKQQLDEWANFVECREDIGFEEYRKETLREIIHWLANPDLGYEVNTNLISKIEEALAANAL